MTARPRRWPRRPRRSDGRPGCERMGETHGDEHLESERSGDQPSPSETIATQYRHRISEVTMRRIRAAGDPEGTHDQCSDPRPRNAGARRPGRTDGHVGPSRRRCSTCSPRATASSTSARSRPRRRAPQHASTGAARPRIAGRGGVVVHTEPHRGSRHGNFADDVFALAHELRRSSPTRPRWRRTRARDTHRPRWSTRRSTAGRR